MYYVLNYVYTSRKCSEDGIIHFSTAAALGQGAGGKRRVRETSTEEMVRFGFKS